jgi:peptide deformylase
MASKKFTKDDIIVLPAKELREQSERIRAIDDDVRELVQQMTDAAIDWEESRPYEISAALAAPQLNILKRAIIVRSDFEEKENREFVALINPEIVKYEGAITSDYEGCLSVSKVYGKVPRYSKIRVKALDIDGNEVRFKADGFLARVIQHEIDHTHGIVFVDHIKDDKDAFYTLDDKGELQPLDYDKDVKNNAVLWD